jgi:hypothetical protein
VPSAIRERLAAVREHDPITWFDVRRGVLHRAEVVAGRVVEAVGRHGTSVAARLPGVLGAEGQ